MNEWVLRLRPLQEHDCGLTRELVSLIDREADLLVRDLRPQAMAGLRKRIASMFFQYCRTPLFNPEAAKHIKVGYFYYIISCGYLKIHLIVHHHWPKYMHSSYTSVWAKYGLHTWLFHRILSNNRSLCLRIVTLSMM